MGEETVDAMRSELLMTDAGKLHNLMDFINKLSDRMLMNKMNAESKAIHTNILKKIKKQDTEK